METPSRGPSDCGSRLTSRIDKVPLNRRPLIAGRRKVDTGRPAKVRDDIFQRLLEIDELAALERADRRDVRRGRLQHLRAVFRVKALAGLDLQTRAGGIRHDCALADEHAGVGAVARDFEDRADIDEMQVAAYQLNLALPCIAQPQEDLPPLKPDGPAIPAGSAQSGCRRSSRADPARRGRSSESLPARSNVRLASVAERRRPSLRQRKWPCLRPRQAVAGRYADRAKTEPVSRTGRFHQRKHFGLARGQAMVGVGIRRARLEPGDELVPAVELRIVGPDKPVERGFAKVGALNHSVSCPL